MKLKIYYADKASKTILARKIHLSDSEAAEDMEERIYSNIIAQSCVVDNEGSNIFFVEGKTRNIQVISTEQVKLSLITATCRFSNKKIRAAAF